MYYNVLYRLIMLKILMLDLHPRLISVQKLALVVHLLTKSAFHVNLMHHISAERPIKASNALISFLAGDIYELIITHELHSLIFLELYILLAFRRVYVLLHKSSSLHCSSLQASDWNRMRYFYCVRSWKL